MAHTDGKWRIGDAGHTVFGPNLGKPSPEIIAGNLSKGNARLIALAPELYEFAVRVSRSACLDQVMNDKCRCFACKAAELIKQIA